MTSSAAILTSSFSIRIKSVVRCSGVGALHDLLICSPTMPQEAPSVSAEAFEYRASGMLRRTPSASDDAAQRRFRGAFGVSPAVCAAAWNLVSVSAPVGALPSHLLWCLLFLKGYATEHVNCAITGADEKTYIKSVWALVEHLSGLKIVSAAHYILISLSHPRA